MSDVRNQTWEDDPQQICELKYKYSEKSEPKTELGTLFWHKTKKEWFVLNTEHQEKYFNVILNKHGPKPVQVPSKAKATKKQGRGGAKQPRPGYERWRSFKPSTGSRMTNFYPSLPSECPKFLTNHPGAPLPKGDQLPPCNHFLAIKRNSPSCAAKCWFHTSGCGNVIKEGDLVVVDGRDTVYNSLGVYEVGVFTVTKGLQRKCKVGVVRVLYCYLYAVTNKYCMVGYVSPKVTDTDSPTSFNRRVKGYFHLHVMEGTCEVPDEQRVARAKANEGSDSTVDDCPYVEHIEFDAILPTQETFEANKKKRKNDDSHGEEK